MSLGRGACPECEGNPAKLPTCSLCRGWNRPMAFACPALMVEPWCYDVLTAADVLELGGGWPSGGGWLNEPAGLVQGVRVVAGERARLMAGG